MKKLLVLFTLLTFSSIGFSQIELSKLAIDAGVTATVPGLGLKVGATYFVNDNLEYYGSLTLNSLRKTEYSQRTAFDLRLGARYKIAQRNRFSTHVGLELGYSYSQSKFRTLDFRNHQYIGVAVPLQFRYRLSDQISIEADLGLGWAKSLTSDNYGFNPSMGLGFKYRLGKSKK